MKHSDVIKAYMVLSNISSDEMPLSISYKLFKVKKMLQPQWDFQKERIDSVMKKYEPVRQMDGSIKFRNRKDGEKCANELNKMMEEIDEMEIDFADIKRPSICLDTDINLSIADIDALSPFVEFTERSTVRNEE